MQEYIDMILRDFLSDNEMFLLEDVLGFVNESLPKDNQGKLVGEINLRIRTLILCLKLNELSKKQDRV